MSEQNQPVPNIVPVQDIDQFAHVITAWHTQKMKELEQALAVPAGVAVEVTDEQGTVEEVMLTGDALKAFRAGLSTAMAALGNLPFVSLDAEEEEPGNTSLAAQGQFPDAG